jgi:hypothetical protein
MVIVGAQITGITAGPFYGVGQETLDVQQKIGGEIDLAFKYKGNKTWEYKREFKTRVQTSPSPDFVGHQGDIFVGGGLNTLYGLCKTIGIGKKEALNPVLFDFGNGYAIGQQTVFNTGMTFGTTFYYTTYEIENIMIPKWEENRKLLLTFDEPTGPVSNPVYYSRLAVDHPNFGKLNNDPVFAGEATERLDGPSYKVYLPQTLEKALDLKALLTQPPSGNEETILFTDSVWYYHTQVKRWKEVLAENERRKAQADFGKAENISFGSGASIEKSHTRSDSYSYSKSFINTTNIYLLSDVYNEVLGVGLQWENKVGAETENIRTDAYATDTTSTVGFLLAETGTTDELSLDFRLDTLSLPHTYMFRTRGGRTSCPYEGPVVTKYFEPGKHTLDAATMQIEVPRISLLSGADRLQVPATRPAVFELQLQNVSETGGTSLFKLTVDETTNSEGAILEIDGSPIGNGRFFTIAAGTPLKKQLTVRKGALVDAHRNIRLVLSSDCDSNLSDSLVLSAEYLPSCSEVNIKAPFDNWIVNTASDKDPATGSPQIQVELDGYDVNFNNFGYVELQYRRASDANWTTEMKFYTSSNHYNDALAPKKLIDPGTEPTIKYWWKKGDKGDGEYEFRAHTVCLTDQGVQVSEYFTPAVRGYIDTSIPEALGAPSPSNGILSPSSEISITFNENIQTGMLKQGNFSITGILNASLMTEPTTGLAFDGSGKAVTEFPEYLSGAFSIETWFKHEPGTEGTLFAYGEGAANSLSLGFKKEGDKDLVVVKLGNQTYVSTLGVAKDQTWKYIGLVFHPQVGSEPERENGISVYRLQGQDTESVMFDKQLVGSWTPPAQGKLYIGNNAEGNSGMKGAVAHVHLYGKARTITEMGSDKNTTKSGYEPYILGLWEMNEGEGIAVTDKVRGRNLIINTGWYIYPVGMALSLDKSKSSVVTIPSATYPFRQYDDFSVELQFKGAPQTNATLISLGADTTHIGFDADGRLTLTRRTTTQTLASANLANNEWHHLALSVKRNGMTTAVVDGAVTASFSSNMLGEVSGALYAIGARYTLDGAQANYSNYFTGSIDEVRVWNTALSTEIIKRNKKHKLRGDEKGLVAYYPFESWVRNIDGSYNVLPDSANVVTGTGRMDIIGQGTLSVVSTVSAAMIDARPEVELGYGPNSDYTYTASDNKIVLNLLTAAYKLEGVALTVTASQILDMRNNESKPVTWIAYVNRNPLNWTTNKVDLATAYGYSTTFSAGITNTGGKPEDYRIENLPIWLNVNAPSGTLQPLATKELVFTVAPSVNIGSYEALVALNGVNNVRKILPVQLKVNGPRPDWKVNPNDFESSMNITGQIKVEGTFQEDPDDLLAAFIGDLCVGITSPIYVSENNAYFTFFDVYGNAEHKDLPLTFKLWDASTGRIYPKVETSVADIRFVATKVVGSLAGPVVFSTLDIAEQIIPLKKGWTWISSNVPNDNPSVFSQIKSSLANTGVIIKGRNAYVQQPNWKGTLSSISEKSMYIINTNKEHVLKLEGKYANPATTPVNINQGWNWIGYIPSLTLPVKDALAGINAQTGDFIKGQTAYATYAGASGWIGSLTYMQEGKGYMYYSNNAAPQTLIYPSTASQVFHAPALRSATAIVPNWSVDYSRFASSMTLTTIVVNNNEEMRSAAMEIGAFSGSECRGSALLQYEPDLDRYIGFLMIYGEDNDVITLKVYDNVTSREYTANNAPLQFVADDMKGSPEAPYIVALGSTTGIESVNTNQIAIYPNPVSVDLHIDRPQENIDVVEIIDLSGRSIFRKTDFSDESINVSGLNKGVYLLKLVSGNQTITRKFTKK